MHFLRILGRRSIYCRICDSKFRPWSFGTPKRQKLVIITSGSIEASLLSDGVNVQPLDYIVHVSQELSISLLAELKESYDGDGDPLGRLTAVILVHEARLRVRGPQLIAQASDRWHEFLTMLLTRNKRYHCLILSRVLLTPRCPSDDPPLSSPSTFHLARGEELLGGCFSLFWPCCCFLFLFFVFVMTVTGSRLLSSARK